MPFIGNQLSTSFQNVETQTITGDGSTSYTLNNAVADGKDLLVYINNVKQEEGSGKSYTATGTTITFTEAVASTDSCYVVFIGQAVGTVTPKDGSIVSSMLADANLEMPNTLDLNGKELILDADADTSITADTDDQIDIKIAGSDNLVIKANEIENVSGDFTLDVAGDIILDADGGDIIFKDGGTQIGRIRNASSGEFTFNADVQDKDIVFNGNDGGSTITAMTIDMSEGGNVGIGVSPTTAYGKVTQIHDTGTSGANLRLTDATSGSGTGNGFEVIQIGANNYYINRENGIIAVYRNNAEVQRIDSNGWMFGQSAFNSNLTGVLFQHNGVSYITADGTTPLYLNRLTSDGNILELQQAGSQEGAISVSGTTVTYGGFSGQHESSGIPTNTPIGTVVSTIDELDVYASKQGEAGKETDSPKAGQTRADHAKVEVSDTTGDSAVYGVVASFNAQGKVNVASVGIGSVRVTGACAKGDLLESNGDGTAKVQDDDIVRSKTLGKVTIGNSSAGVKLVSCVLYCG